jgi:hypothetical protein
MPMSSAIVALNSCITNALYYDQIGRNCQTDAVKWEKTGVNGSIKD